MTLKCSSVSSTHFALLIFRLVLFSMWEQNVWVGPNQRPIEPPNIPILFLSDLVLLHRGNSLPRVSDRQSRPLPLHRNYLHTDGHNDVAWTVQTFTYKKKGQII